MLHCRLIAVPSWRLREFLCRVVCVHFAGVLCVHFPVCHLRAFPHCYRCAFPCLSSACISLFVICVHFHIVICVHFPFVLNVHFPIVVCVLIPIFCVHVFVFVSVCLAQSCCPSTLTAQSSPPRCFCAQLSPSGPLVLQIYNARTLFVFSATVPHAVVCYPAVIRAGELIQATNSTES